MDHRRARAVVATGCALRAALLRAHDSARALDGRRGAFARGWATARADAVGFAIQGTAQHRPRDAPRRIAQHLATGIATDRRVRHSWRRDLALAHSGAVSGHAH